MAGQQVEQLYKAVIEDVIRNARDEFLNEGIDENTLVLLQRLWESKLLQHAPGGSMEQYDAGVYPQADAMAAYTQHPMYQQQQQQQLAAASNALASLSSPARSAIPPQHAAAALAAADEAGRPQPFMTKAVATGMPGRMPHTAGFPPQHDGAAEEPPAPLDRAAIDADLIARLAAAQQQRVAQFDGDGDSDEDDGAAGAAGTKSDDEDNLSSISVDEDDDAVDTENEVLCQYDKVSHTKNTKWRAVLKDGIMHIGGQDYVFSKATGEFTW